MEWALNLWQSFLDARIGGFSAPIVIWIVGSYILSILFLISERNEKSHTNRFLVLVLAPMFWPMVIFSAAIGLILADTMNGFIRMFQFPLTFLFFAITQAVVVIPAMPDELPAFFLDSRTLHIVWSPVWQYVAVAAFGASLILFRWWQPRILGQETQEQKFGIKFLHALPLLLLVFSGIFLGDLLISQAFVSLGTFFLIAAGVWVSMALEELTKKNPHLSDAFRGVLAAFSLFRRTAR